MIILNGTKLAKNNSEFIDSLFQGKSTCSGYYRVNSKTITILDHNKVKVGVITERGILARATKVDSGWWYSYGDIDIVGAYDCYSEQCNEPRDIYQNLIGTPSPG